MRQVSRFHSSHLDVRSARVALAAAAVAGLVVIAACTDRGDKSVTGPPSGPRNSSATQGGLTPFANAGKVVLCVDKNSPVGNYTFTYSHQNDQEALEGNRPYSGGFWTDEGGDWQSAPGEAFATVGFPGQLADGSTTVFAPANVIVNDGITTACLTPLSRTEASLAFRTLVSSTDTYSGITIAATSNDANAVYSHTDCLLDVGVLIPEHTIPNALSIPLWSPATGYAINALTRTNDGTFQQIWRALVAVPSGGATPTEGVNWSTADLGPCGTGNDPTRALANVVHGIVVTFVFVPEPQQEVIPLFVIGDLTDHDINDNVYFWWSQWWKNNPMSLFHTNGWESFKGYASAVDLTNTSADAPCGTWTSRVGNSPPPPAVIPEFVGIIVTDNVIKIGPGEGGNIKEIIIVHSDGKYSANPGHAGKGPVTEKICPAQ